MTEISSHLSSIEFIPAICPSCGGELRVPEGRESVKCNYCGVDIVLQTKKTLGDKHSLDTIAHLLKIAIKGKNYSEAYHYSIMALEINSQSGSAWAVKGLCAAWLSTPDTTRLHEAIQCFQEALRLGLKDDQESTNIMLQSFTDSVVSYTKAVQAFLAQEYEECLATFRSRTSYDDIRGIYQLKDRLTDKFFTRYGEPIKKSLDFIWQTLPIPEIARKIQFLQWDFNPIACPWLYTLDHRLTQGCGFR